MAIGARSSMLGCLLLWPVMTVVKTSANNADPFQTQPNMLKCSKVLQRCIVQSDGGYNAYEPPPQMGNPNPMEVGIGISIRSMKYDIMNANLALDYWIRIAWYDSRLDFTAGAFGVNFSATSDFIAIPLKKGDNTNIWIPDVSCFDAVDSSKNLDDMDAWLYGREHNAVGKFPFNVLSTRPGHMNVYCQASSDQKSLPMFPFDKQTCNLNFASWAWSNKFIKLVPLVAGYQKFTFPDSSEYHYRSNVTTFSDVFYEAVGKYWSNYHVKVKLQRLPMYYVLNAVVPMFMMVVLSNMVFWIPVNPNHSGSGERIGFTITCLLTIYAVDLFTADKRPNVGVTTWLDRWISSCLLFTFLPILETIFVCWLSGVFDSVASGKQHEEAWREQMERDPLDVDPASNASPKTVYNEIIRNSAKAERRGGKKVLKNIGCLAEAVPVCKYWSPRNVDKISRHVFPVCAGTRLLFLISEVWGLMWLDSKRYDTPLSSWAFKMLAFPMMLIFGATVMGSIVWLCWDTYNTCTNCDDPTKRKYLHGELSDEDEEEEEGTEDMEARLT